MVEDEHHDYCTDYCDQIPYIDGDEIVFGRNSGSIIEILDYAHAFATLVFLDCVVESCVGNSFQNIKSQAQWDKNAWDNDISQTKYWILWFFSTVIFRELKLDRCIYTFRNCKHNISTKYEKDIIEEKQHKQHHSILKIANKHRLKGENAEDDAQYIVIHPTSADNVEDHLDSRYDATENVEQGDLKFQSNQFDINVNDIVFVVGSKGTWSHCLDYTFYTCWATQCDITHKEIINDILTKILHAIIKSA